MCRETEENYTPKYTLTLEFNNDQKMPPNNIFTLKIIETNAFKNLTHLLLNFKLSTDTEMRQYLCQSLKSLKQENVNMEITYKHLEKTLSNQLNDTEKAYKCKVKEFKELKDELEGIEKNISNKFLKESKDEKDKLNQQIMKLQKKLENERASSENRINQNIRDYKNKADWLDQENQKLKRQLSIFNVEKTKMMSDYDSKITELEKELISMKTVLKRLQDKYETSKNEKDKFANQIEKRQEDFQFIQDSSQKLLEDMDKGHEIIQKLQQENRFFQNKLKDQNVIILKQETYLEGKEKAIKDLNNRLSDILTHEECLLNEVNELRKINDGHRVENENLHTKIKLNETVISWLNKQINELKYSPDQKGSPKNAYNELHGDTNGNIKKFANVKISHNNSHNKNNTNRISIPPFNVINPSNKNSNSDNNNNEVTLPDFYFKR
ncbi:unnamed protein product [Gordionus sp. m RMFG-2023]